MTIAIGDIHGCLAPLRLLVERLPAGETLVFLGDYVDRGPYSAGVIRYLRRLAKERPCRFLKGNHEDLMERAIADPGEIELWLVNGGGATLRSYGLEIGEWARSRDRSAFLGQDRDFIAGLELYVEDEDSIFVHAGVDPREPDMSRQKAQVLLWTREAFFRNAALWKGKQIFFGHTPTRIMGLPPGEIFHSRNLFGIDTGCVYGGALTAIDSRTHEVFQERSDYRYGDRELAKGV
jgi:serine/threonine protein phosphatase 1